MEVKVIGGPCGYHGAYTFYKGVRVSPIAASLLPSHSTPKANSRKCTAAAAAVAASSVVVTAANHNNGSSGGIERRDSDGSTHSGSSHGGKTQQQTQPQQPPRAQSSLDGSAKPLVLALGDCVPVRPWSDSPITCLAELRMVWRDKVEQCLLTGLRLYFLPENTPIGRRSHGEDEVLAISDKVVIRADDLLTWMDHGHEWQWGLQANSVQSKPQTYDEADLEVPSLKSTQLDFGDVNEEKVIYSRSKIAVVSYARYCRYRATLKRLENVADDWLRNTLIEALGGFTSSGPDTRVMFCKDTFDYPELETHELLCNHLAPKFKGRPRGRRKKITVDTADIRRRSRCDSPGSESAASEISACSVEKVYSKYSPMYVKPEFKQGTHVLATRPPLRYNTRPARRSVKSESETSAAAAAVSVVAAPVAVSASVTAVMATIATTTTTTTASITATATATTATKAEPSVVAVPALPEPVPCPIQQSTPLRPALRSRPSGGSGAVGTNSSSSTSSNTRRSSARRAAVSTSEHTSGSETDGESGSAKSEHHHRLSSPKKPAAGAVSTSADDEAAEAAFLRELLAFHDEQAADIPPSFWTSLRNTHLLAILRTVQQEGGYEKFSEATLWKTHFGNTLARNKMITRAKYQRALLPYEKHLLATGGRIKCETKAERRNGGGDDGSSSEADSLSGAEADGCNEEPLQSIFTAILTKADAEGMFLRNLLAFHADQNTDIPVATWRSLRRVNLFSVYRQVQEWGGYERASDKQLWNIAFGLRQNQDMFISRTSYRRAVLPYEKHMQEVAMKAIKLEAAEAARRATGGGGEVKRESPDLLTVAEMTEIQRRLKERSEQDAAVVAGATTQVQSPVSVPVTVIVGGVECHTSSPSQISIQQPHTTITVHQTTIHPQNVHHLSSSSPSAGHMKSPAHQPNITNQIQIHNQIQIQQITVQPSDGQGGAAGDAQGRGGNGGASSHLHHSGPYTCSIKQDRHGGQEVHIESVGSGDCSAGKHGGTHGSYMPPPKFDPATITKSSGGGTGAGHSLRHVRVRSDRSRERGKSAQHLHSSTSSGGGVGGAGAAAAISSGVGPLEKENIPFLAGNRATTITPVLGNSNNNKDMRLASPEVIDLLDSDNDSNDGTTPSGGGGSGSGGVNHSAHATLSGLHNVSVTPVSHSSGGGGAGSGNSGNVGGSSGRASLPTSSLSSLHPPAAAATTNATSNSNSSTTGTHMKKRKLEILREGGLEVTAISGGASGSTKSTLRPEIVGAIPGTSTSITASGTHKTLPQPQFQSKCMYSTTGRVFGNPNDQILAAITPVSVAPPCTGELLDLSSWNLSGPLSLTQQAPRASPGRLPANLSISELANSKMKSDPSLQITLVPTPMLTHVQNIHNSQNHNIKKRGAERDPPQIYGAPDKHPRLATSSSSSASPMSPHGGSTSITTTSTAASSAAAVTPVTTLNIPQFPPPEQRINPFLLQHLMNQFHQSSSAAIPTPVGSAGAQAGGVSVVAVPPSPTVPDTKRKSNPRPPRSRSKKQSQPQQLQSATSAQQSHHMQSLNIPQPQSGHTYQHHHTASSPTSTSSTSHLPPPPQLISGGSQHRNSVQQHQHNLPAVTITPHPPPSPSSSSSSSHNQMLPPPPPPPQQVSTVSSAAAAAAAVGNPFLSMMEPALFAMYANPLFFPNAFPPELMQLYKNFPAGDAGKAPVSKS